MATFTFDGTGSLTATKGDTVFITADPTTFTQASDDGLNVTLAFGTNKLTITGTTLIDGALPNVFVTGGQLTYGGIGSTNTDLPATTGNLLAFHLADSTPFTYATDSSTATSKVAIFGGLGRVSPLDGGDSITIGGKGSILVHGNGGDDAIDQTTAFDSTSIVNVFGDIGADSITLIATNTKASIFVGGGAGVDSISVTNSGSTTIFGGDDSTDGGDLIAFTGVDGAGGTSVIFGNGGNDQIFVGNDLFDGIDSTTTTTVFGGFGDDFVFVANRVGEKATVSVIGGEGSDEIIVFNDGNTFIAGGNEAGDQSLDGADTITFVGSGTALIYGNVGTDSIAVNLDTENTANVSIYGGRDADTINVLSTAAEGASIGAASVFVAGGEDGDSISVQGSGGAVTIYGGISSTDSTDGADTISFEGAGTANIFGNGGADSISIGAVAPADSTNAVVTVSGGVGNDSISIAAQQDSGQAIVVSGNEGTDTFTIAKGTGQSITVGDFAVGSSGDKLVLTGLTGASPGNLQVTAPPSGGFQTLQQALDAASSASGGTDTQNKAAAVVFAGSTYVVIETGTASGFQAGADQAIKLTGVTSLVDLVGRTSLTGTDAPPPP